MNIPTLTTEVARVEELFTAEEERALIGFLAGYSGLTRDAYALDLRQYATWCSEHRVSLFCARRADIECFGRHPRDAWPGPRNHRAAAVHHRLLLPLRGGGRPY